MGHNFNSLLAQAERRHRDCPQDLRPISEVVKSLSSQLGVPLEPIVHDFTASSITNKDAEALYLAEIRAKRLGRTQAAKVIPLDFCSGCGTTRDLHRHHKNAQPWDNDPSNLVVLCRRCHNCVHEGLSSWRPV